MNLRLRFLRYHLRVFGRLGAIETVPLRTAFRQNIS